MAFDKDILFYNNRARDARLGSDGTEYATCVEAVADPDDPNKVRGEIVPAADVSAIADLEDGDNNHLLCLDTSAPAVSVSFPAGHLVDPNRDLNPDTHIAVDGVLE